MRPTVNGTADAEFGIARDGLAVQFGAVAALEVGQREGVPFGAKVGVAARDVPVERYAGLDHGIVATDRNLAVERPGLPVQGSAQYLQLEHGRDPFKSDPARPLNKSGRGRLLYDIHYE